MRFISNGQTNPPSSHSSRLLESVAGRIEQEFIHDARFRSILLLGNEFNSFDDLRLELVHLRNRI
jgi:hypothetical protein